MDNKDELKMFMNLFNDLSEDASSDDDQIEEYGATSKKNVSFEKGLEEVKKELKSCENGFSEEDPHETMRRMCKPEETVEEIVFEDKVQEENIENNKEDIQEEIIEESEEDEFKEEEKIKNDKEEDFVFDSIPPLLEEKNGNKTVESPESKQSKCLKKGLIQWSLKSPVPLYNSFYRKKQELIELSEQSFMLFPIDFKSLNEELINSSVDISSQTFDKDVVLKQMELVQQYRERVKNISIQCNIQYFLWKRWIEKDALRGYLAKVEYLKPAIKQEGLVLEHMGDFEYYYSQLEALYNNCSKVEKTLEAAFDTLSRKVSICMELRTSDRYSKEGSSIYEKTNIKEEREEKDSFDAIQEGEVAKKKSNSPFCGWES